MTSGAFRAGDDVQVLGANDQHDVALRRRSETVGTLRLGPGSRSAQLSVGPREWRLAAYGGGWRIAAFDRDGRVAAAYGDRWLLAGRVWIGRREAALQIPLALRCWTLRADGARVLSLDRDSKLRPAVALSGRVAALPDGWDHEPLVGFALAIVWMRVRFRVRPLKSVHVVEGYAESLDALLEVGDADIDELG